jgi:hypothetical protein
MNVTAAGMLVALRGGGCAGVRRLDAPHGGRRWSQQHNLTADEALQLAAACPNLQHVACEVECSLPDEAAAVLAALPGLLSLVCLGDGAGTARVTQLAERLRVNTTLTSLDLCLISIRAAGVKQLADCLRVNAHEPQPVPNRHRRRGSSAVCGFLAR